jgi:hypothetical protein
MDRVVSTDHKYVVAGEQNDFVVTARVNHGAKANEGVRTWNVVSDGSDTAAAVVAPTDKHAVVYQ